MAQHKYPLALLGFVTLVFIWSAIGPHDRLTWWMEVMPAIIAAALLIPTANKFPLTPLLYTLVAVHAVILIVGGHYTYAHVPIGNWIKEVFGTARNSYDGLGHFAQGFIPAMAARELLLRTSPLRPGKWLFTLIILGCLGISAIYELIEWAAAVIMGGSADEFLGTQGDVWDTQKDIFLAGVGAIAALLLLSRLHDRQLEKL